MSLRVVGLATLTRDAEVNKKSNGAWIKFGIATRRRNVPEGMQDVDFFEANYFVKNPDSPVVGYLTKGTSIYIDNAEVRADMYEKDGKKSVFNKINLFSFDFVNTKKASEDSPAETKAPAVEPAKKQELPPEVEGSAEFYEDDEPPF